MTSPLSHHCRGLLRISLAALCLAGTGCQMYRTLGSGQRIDTSNARPYKELNRQTKVIQLEVTTDAGGAISNIRFVRSSGRPGIDAYVVESLKTNWPNLQGGPLMKSLIELSYSQAAGFSDPKVLSSVPL